MAGQMPDYSLLFIKDCTIEKVRGNLRVSGVLVSWDGVPTYVNKDKLVEGHWEWRASQVPLKTKAKVPYVILNINTKGVVGLWPS